MKEQQWRREVQASLLRAEARNDQFWAQFNDSPQVMATVKLIADLGFERARQTVGNSDLFEAVIEAMANKISGDATIRRLRWDLDFGEPESAAG